MPKKLSRIWTLFGVFFKIGAFTFGGGYAMIPLISREIVEKRRWLSAQELLDVVAIAESTPGPIAVNSATFVGYKIAGVPGAFAATFGVVLPSFVVITLLSFVLRQFEQLRAVKYAFFGVRAGVLALLFKALFSMYRQCPHNRLSLILMAIAFLATAFLQISPLIVIAGCALAGLAAAFFCRRSAQ